MDRHINNVGSLRVNIRTFVGLSGKVAPIPKIGHLFQLCHGLLIYVSQ